MLYKLCHSSHQVHQAASFLHLYEYHCTWDSQRNTSERREAQMQERRRNTISLFLGFGFGVNEKSYAIIMFWNNDTGAVPVLGVVIVVLWAFLIYRQQGGVGRMIPLGAVSSVSSMDFVHDQRKVKRVIASPDCKTSSNIFRIQGAKYIRCHLFGPKIKIIVLHGCRVVHTHIQITTLLFYHCIYVALAPNNF